MKETTKKADPKKKEATAKKKVKDVPKKDVPKKEAPPAPAPKKVIVVEGTDVRSLSDQLQVSPKNLQERLAKKGLSLTPNDVIEENLAEILSKDLDRDIEWVTMETAARRKAESDPSSLVSRPPVVTIMGHVDHGKTTLLDALRQSNIVGKEHGGITQHIGAYRIKFQNRSITFIDTPGHEAFTQLRARGAQVTDIVILVAAADEGVMPQTREAISHAQAAGVPVIVAINKIDKPEANPERIKQQLSKEGLLVEEWGGQTVSVDISAKEKKNLKDLLEMILLVTDMTEIKGNPKVPAQGVVLEARLDPKKGPLATVIIQHGLLKAGESFIAGTASGKVRAMFDDNGASLKSADLSMPVEILGFSDVPAAGEFFLVTPSSEQARLIVERRLERTKTEAPGRPAHVTLDDLFKKIEEEELKDLAIILKADVQGSVEVLRDLLPSLGTDKVKIKIIHSATGNISESDILLASTSNAVVLGYNIRPNAKILDFAKRESVDVRSYNVIYQLTEDIKKAVAGMIEPTVKEKYLGRAEIRKIFRIPKVGVIAGCFVTDGKIVRNAQMRILRGDEVVHKGRISSLKRIKENVAEVKKDYECGIGLEKFKDIQEGDIIEAFAMETVRPM